eukprot:scpid108104/ scgid18355/ 
MDEFLFGLYCGLSGQTPCNIEIAGLRWRVLLLLSCVWYWGFSLPSQPVQFMPFWFVILLGGVFALFSCSGIEVLLPSRCSIQWNTLWQHSMLGRHTLLLTLHVCLFVTLCLSRQEYISLSRLEHSPAMPVLFAVFVCIAAHCYCNW